MKKYITKIVTALSLFSIIGLTSCNHRTISSNANTTNIADNELYLANQPTLEYSQGMNLDTSSMEVKAKINGKEETISDYLMRYKDSKEAVRNGDPLNEVTSGKEIEVYKDGFKSTSFTIIVHAITDSFQSLRITANPNKETYKIGEKVNLDGLTVSVVTNYYNENNEKEKFTTIIPTDKLNITIEDEKIDEYVFKDVGRHMVNITYQGISKMLNSSFIVNSEISELKKPSKINDDSINWEQDDTSMKVTFSNSNRTTANKNVEELDKNNPHKGYLDPSQVEVPYNASTYGLNNYDKWQYSPSLNSSNPSDKNSTTNFLVVPIVAPGNSKLATPKLWDTINKAFFGKSDEVYFESLRSYYQKSSFNQLDIAGSVTDYYYPEKESTLYNTHDKIHKATNDQNGRISFFNEITSWIKKKYTYINLQDYDSNNDGVIDGMWFVYVYPTKSSSQTTTWAYSSSTQQDGDINDPKINNYGWVTSPFLNPTDSPNDQDCDAHVVIHESGHMFGLKDYYTTDGTYHDPLGRTDMMEVNSGDHNPFSKLYMGWVTPYIVYGDNVEITIPSSQVKDALIIIPYDTKTYKKNEETGKYTFNMFDEYLILDYYTPLNMNANFYQSYGSSQIQASGGRLYHVDNRLVTIDGKNEDATQTNSISYYNSTLFKDETVDEDIKTYMTSKDEQYANKFLKVISNTYSGAERKYYGIKDPNADLWDEIKLITADGTNLGSTPGTSYIKANENSLFYKNRTDTTNVSFSLTDKKYQDQFVDGAFDNKQAFSYSFTINEFPKN